VSGPSSGGETFEGATGIGLLDRAIMGELHRANAGMDGPTIRGHLLLASLDVLGIPPEPAYAYVATSVDPELTWVQLYRKVGNLGSRLDPPAWPDFVHVGLSEIGDLLVRRGGTPVLPVAFANGNVHLDGSRPAFDPVRVIDAVIAAASDPSVPDRELVDLVGDPDFPCGCHVECDTEALHAGEATPLTMAAHLDPDPTGTRLVMTGVPPTVDPGPLVTDLCGRALPPPSHPGHEHTEALPLRDLWDRSTHEADDHYVLRYELTPRTGTTLDELADLLRRERGITDGVVARLPAPTATIIRHHARGDADDVVAFARRLRELLLEAVR
jgi:hypothetical protein